MKTAMEVLINGDEVVGSTHPLANGQISPETQMRRAGISFQRQATDADQEALRKAQEKRDRRAAKRGGAG